MQLCLGLAMGIAAAWLIARIKRKRRSDRRMAVHRQQQHEYHNFLHYDGEQQEEYHGHD